MEDYCTALPPFNEYKPQGKPKGQVFCSPLHSLTMAACVPALMMLINEVSTPVSSATPPSPTYEPSTRVCEDEEPLWLSATFPGSSMPNIEFFVPRHCTVNLKRIFPPGTALTAGDPPRLHRLWRKPRK